MKIALKPDQMDRNRPYTGRLMTLLLTVQVCFNRHYGLLDQLDDASTLLAKTFPLGLTSKMFQFCSRFIERYGSHGTGATFKCVGCLL